MIKSVRSFQSAVYFAVLKFEFIIRALTNFQIHTIGGVDWHLPNRKVTYLRSSFLLFDAAIFCLEALKQKILDCPENIFSPVKLPTLYPGYVLKGEVHHSMRGLF